MSCISFYSYIKPQLVSTASFRACVVYRSIPTSNRNMRAIKTEIRDVVYRSIPTSNRNQCRLYDFYYELYIVLFLHQTATAAAISCIRLSCISFYSYIKPQPKRNALGLVLRCISFYSYIKPQPKPSIFYTCIVVYRSIPTSNRNIRRERYDRVELYIVLFLHQTATFPFGGCTNRTLYIVLFLHQTATVTSPVANSPGCISFYSYIKPQLP